MTKLKGKAKARARAKARKNYTAKQLFGENTRYTDTEHSFRAKGKRMSWDASGGKGPMAMFTLPHEAAKLINTMETEPVQYSTRLIKSDWDKVENTMRQQHIAKNLTPEYLAGFFMAIVPTQNVNIGGNKVSRGIISPQPPKGVNEYDWSDQVQNAFHSFQQTPLNDNFLLLSTYCTPDMVWARCETVFKYFNYAAVAFSNPLSFEILSENCQFQAVWNGKMNMSDVRDVKYGPNVLEAMATHGTTQ